MTDKKLAWVMCVLIFITACHSDPKKSQPVVTMFPNIAEQFLDAYNAHDQKKMLELVHPEIRYMYIDDDQIYTETNSKTTLADFLVNYFKGTPEAQSKLLSSNLHGPFIHQVEQALWKDESGEAKSQCSLSVYEIKQQLIINVWYFAAFKCPLK